MSSSEQSPEPTMDEILASIRRIIADEPTIPSHRSSAPAAENREAPDEGVVNDIARALSQGSGDGPPNGAGDDIFELTNEVEKHGSPTHELPKAAGAGNANTYPPRGDQPAVARPAPERAGAGHEAASFVPGPNHAPHPNMGPREPPPYGGQPYPAPPFHGAPPPGASRDPLYQPNHPGHPSAAGGPPPQPFAGPAGYANASMTPETGRMPPPRGPAPPGPGGHGPTEGMDRFDGGESRANVAAPPVQGGRDPLEGKAPSVETSGLPREMAEHRAANEIPAGHPMAERPPFTLGTDGMTPPQAHHGTREPGAAMRREEPPTADDEPPVDDVEVEAGASTTSDGKFTGDTTGLEFGSEPESSFEKSVKEMLKPMLRDWLDDNMPRLLEGAMKDQLKSRSGKKDEE